MELFKFLSFLSRFTQRELKEGKKNITDLTNKWFNDIQGSPLLVSESEEEEILHPRTWFRHYLSQLMLSLSFKQFS